MGSKEPFWISTAENDVINSITRTYPRKTKAMIRSDKFGTVNLP